MVKKVLGDPGSLCLPVQPQASRTVVNVVVPVSNVDGGVHLDATDFGPGQVLADINIVDIIIFNQGADTTEVPNDSGLPTVMDMVAADNMGAHMLLIPALVGSLANGVPLSLGTILVLPLEPLIIIVWLEVLAKGNTRTLGVRNITVFYNPALRPVRANHPLLVSCRRGPLGCRLSNAEASQRNVTNSLLLRIEAILTNIDFYVLFVWVRPLEVGVNHRFVSRPVP